VLWPVFLPTRTDKEPIPERGGPLEFEDARTGDSQNIVFSLDYVNSSNKALAVSRSLV
jgi:hypothetical protein